MVRDNKWSVPLKVLLSQNISQADKVADDYWEYLRGLPNEDNLFSYANVCIQSLLHYHEIRSELTKMKDMNIIKSVFNQFVAKDSVDIKVLRGFIDEEYLLPIAYYAPTFLKDLLQKFEIFKKLFSYDLRTVTKCFTCNERSESAVNDNYILYLHLSDISTACTLKDIIDNNSGSWRQTEEICRSGCAIKTHQRVDVCYLKNLLIVQLLISNMKHVKIKDVPRSQVNINKRYYNVISGIFHTGMDPEECNYFNMLEQDNHWFKVANLHVDMKPWPKCSEGAFIFFLRETPNSKYMK